MTYGAQIARLRVATETGVLPRDLASWLLEELTQRASRCELVAMRNHLLREAAQLLVGRSTWARAEVLAREIAAHQRRHSEGSEVRALVAAALEVDPRTPRSVRHLFEILKNSP